MLDSNRDVGGRGRRPVGCDAAPSKALLAGGVHRRDGAGGGPLDLKPVLTEPHIAEPVMVAFDGNGRM